MMAKYLDHSEHLFRVVVLIDAEHGFKKLDENLCEMLNVKKKPFIACMTKCDKIP